MSKGFTLLELLLSIAIIMIIAATSVPVYLNLQSRNDVAITKQLVSNAVYRAQVYAKAMKEDSSWSVQTSGKTITLFQGSNYSTRDSDFDELSNIPNTASFNQTSTISFVKLTAALSTSSNIEIVSGNESSTIEINSEGVLSYE